MTLSDICILNSDWYFLLHFLFAFLIKTVLAHRMRNLFFSFLSPFPLLCLKTECGLYISLIFLPFCFSVYLMELQVFYDPPWTHAQKSDYLPNALTRRSEHPKQKPHISDLRSFTNCTLFCTGNNQRTLNYYIMF